ncbi:MAG: extracellular solute-binding protein [Treponema sp.]|nr:extracellular solute-binding protein [Treponema sp.]
MIRTSKFVFSTLIICAAIFFCGCSNSGGRQKKRSSYQQDRIVIWTSNREFVQYVELYNKHHKNSSAILVYKENPALSLPPAKDEMPPDIVVGSWLKTESPKKYFKSLDYLFDTKKLSSDLFYSQVLDFGRHKKVQYLLPVSFNLPAIIFSAENHDLIPDNYVLSLEQIRETASAYNTKNQKDAYTRIGFTPLGNTNFLYLTAKMKGTAFREEKGDVTWNKKQLDETIAYLKDWVNSENTSAQVEEDFSFKYLFMPYYRQVSSGRTLFAYTTSNQLFKVLKEQYLPVDYRWVVEDNSLYIEDSCTMMGICKKAQNQIGATEFISWFFQSESQKEILETKEKMGLETDMFGIAGGFSSLRDVTEHILPAYYNQLLTNLPPAQMLAVPQRLPARWESYRTLAVEPYIKACVIASENEVQPNFDDFEKEWRKKVFD